MRGILKPNPAVHVQVGAFWIPARGIQEDVFVETEEGAYIRLGCFQVERILQELGVDVDKPGWASWEHDDWEIDGDKIRFSVVHGKLTAHPETYNIEIDAETVKRTLLLLKCPYWSKVEHKVVLRNCESCIFSKHWDGYDCLWRAPQLKPLHEIRRNGMENYVGIELFKDCDFGAIAAFLSFTIQEKVVNRLIDSLYANYDTSETEKDGVIFKKYWDLFGHPTQYYIVINGTDGFIRAEESGECYSHEDWQNLKFYLPYKKNYVLKAFAEICWKASGKVTPRYHGRWTMAQFRRFWALVEGDSG